MRKSILITGAFLPVLAASASDNKPDILFIFVDDMTYDGLSALGNPDVISPNMDRIVKSGVSFENTYNMGAWNGAISQASRTQLITGKYVWNAYHDQMGNKFQPLFESRSTWPQVMQDAGYKTFHAGKWHTSYLSPRKLFQVTGTGRGGMAGDNYYTSKIGYNRPLSRDDNSWQPWDKSQGGYWKGGKHWSVVLADEAIAYMEKNKDSKEPLFMSCAFNAPHDPRQSPKEYVDMYDVDKIDVPESFLPQNPLMDEMKCGKDLRDEALAPWPRTEYAVKKHRQEYYSLITHLDDQVGRILDALEASGRADNTLIVFTADNGLALGKHGLMGKQSLYEHSTKIPLVFAGCGLPKGETRKQLVYMQDLVPTIYELAGIDKPKSVDFVSQLDVLRDKKAEPKRDGVYGSYLDKQRMVRNERYKLIFIPDAKRFLLFDLKKDPQEMKDLSQNKKYDDIVKVLAAKYLKLSKEAGDDFDVTKFFPNIF